jgi:hypothetical protein
VDAKELAVYTGLDEFWLERAGADGSHLDTLKQAGNDSYAARSAPTAWDIENQQLSRQAFFARTTFARTAGPEPTNWTPKDLAARQLMLHAGDRRFAMGYPMMNQHPIDDSKPLGERTSILPEYVADGFRTKLSDVHFQIGGFPETEFPATFKNPAPLLTPNGESVLTMIDADTKKEETRWRA